MGDETTKTFLNSSIGCVRCVLRCWRQVKWRYHLAISFLTGLWEPLCERLLFFATGMGLRLFCAIFCQISQIELKNILDMNTTGSYNDVTVKNI